MLKAAAEIFGQRNLIFKLDWGVRSGITRRRQEWEHMTNAERQFGRSDFTKLFAVSAVFLAAAGCATHDARKHLEGVAKGWCETIRASQIIPVYPLTQDLTVGDVFLVQTPISKQSDDQEIVDGTPAAEVLAKATNLCDNNTGAFLLPGWRKALPADC